MKGHCFLLFLRSEKFKFQFESIEVWVQISLVHSNLYGALVDKKDHLK